MEHDIKKFFGAFELQYPPAFSETELQEHIGIPGLEILLAENIFSKGKSITSAFCPSCGELHDVEISKDGNHLVCTDEHTGRVPLPNSDLITYQVEILNFLNLLTKQLKIKPKVREAVPENIWEIGIIKRDENSWMAYYCRSNFARNISFFNGVPFQNIVVFTNVDVPAPASKKVITPITLSDILKIQKDDLVWDKQAFEEFIFMRFRNLSFNSQNGDLSLHGNILGTIPVGSPEYHFINILWMNFDVPLSHQLICEHVLKKMKKKSTKSSSSDFCYQRMKIIKQKIGLMADKIIISEKTTKNENGYRMKNP